MSRRRFSGRRFLRLKPVFGKLWEWPWGVWSLALVGNASGTDLCVDVALLRGVFDKETRRKPLNELSHRRLPLPILPARLNIERSWRNGRLAQSPIPARCRPGSPYLLITHPAHHSVRCAHYCQQRKLHLLASIGVHFVFVLNGRTTRFVVLAARVVHSLDRF